MAEDTVARILTEGDMEVHGRIAGSYNATLLVTCRLGDEELMAVYKPHKGERPLWDFPDGLYRREVEAYEVSAALGWGIVPETVLRDDAQRVLDKNFPNSAFAEANKKKAWWKFW